MVYEDYSDHPMNYTDMVEKEAENVVANILDKVIVNIVIVTFAFNILLIIPIVVTKELREKTSYWFIVSLMISNNICVYLYFGNGRNKNFFTYPECHVLLPLAMASYHVSLWTIAVYAIFILHEARQAMKLKNPTGCRKAVVGGVIAALWIVNLVEVFIMGFAVTKMEVVSHHGQDVCIFMPFVSPLIRDVRSVFTTYIPYLTMFICGIVFTVLCCKSHIVRQTCVPVTLMCVITPMFNLPYVLLMHPSIYSTSSSNELIALRAFSWLLVPLYFLIFGEGRKAVRNAYCQCCYSRPSNEEEATHSDIARTPALGARV